MFCSVRTGLDWIGWGGGLQGWGVFDWGRQQGSYHDGTWFLLTYWRFVLKPLGGGRKKGVLARERARLGQKRTDLGRRE